MSGQDSGLFAFVKSAFYKFCFCLGLGTASYYSYAQVKDWVDPGSRAITSSSHGLQGKVDALMSRPAVQPEFAVAQAAENNQAPSPITFQVHSTPSESASPQAPEETPAVVADANASPSPAVSPTPGEATAEVPKEGEAPKEGEVAPVAQASEAAPLPVSNMPPESQIQQFAQYAQAAQNAVAPTGDANAAAGAAAPNAAGTAGAGSAAAAAANAPIPTGSLAGSAAGASAPVSYGATSVSSSSGATTVNSNAATGFLSQADLALLKNPMKATLADQTINVGGVTCSLSGADNSVKSCDKTTSYPVHTSRWSDTQGLSSDATLSMKAGTGTNQLEVDFSLKLQDLQQAYTTITASAAPSDVSVKTETENSKNYKVFTVTLPDVTLSNGEKISSLSAVLRYEVAASGTVLSTNSAFTFVRSHIQTTNSIWDFTGTNRAPAASDQVVVADKINYSMNLEKSP